MVYLYILILKPFYLKEWPFSNKKKKKVSSAKIKAGYTLNILVSLSIFFLKISESMKNFITLPSPHMNIKKNRVLWIMEVSDLEIVLALINPTEVLCLITELS